MIMQMEVEGQTGPCTVWMDHSDIASMVKEGESGACTVITTEGNGLLIPDEAEFAAILSQWRALRDGG